MISGPPDLKSEPPAFSKDTSQRCRVMTYTKDGALFAWCNGDSVKIVETKSFQQVCEIDKPKTKYLKFSPKGSLLALWEPYTVDKETKSGVPNLHIFDVKTGACLKSLIQKKETFWAPEWTDDEKLCIRNVNNELHCFEESKFDEIKVKLHLQKIASFSLASAGPPYMVAGYVPGTKGQPSFVRLYRYPNFGGPNAAVANRTFFKADKVEMMWNSTATAMLLLTTTETSESSYYGDQGLHYVGVNGEGNLVHLGKNGPVYHVEWSPKGTEFVVVYGFMPAKATIYNMKTEPVFDFGTGPRNFGYYNPQGTILCLCGFGNLRGNMEFWDTKQWKMIAQAQSPDTTAFSWCADGEHVVTSTTAPRLRVANGYRVWHYSGVVIEQVLTGKDHELWEVSCQPAPVGAYPDRPISYRQVQSEAPTPVIESKQAGYVPPALRGQANRPAFKLHEYEPPSNLKQSQADPSKPISKNKKKRDAKKAKAAEQGAQDGGATPQTSSNPAPQPSIPMVSTGDPEKDKRIRNIKKKLQQIDKLKADQQSGKQMEKNQLDKMKTEDGLLKELEELELS